MNRERQDLKQIPPAVDHTADEMLSILQCNDETLDRHLSEAVGYARQALESWMTPHVMKVVDATMLGGDRAAKVFLWMLMLHCTWRGGCDFLYKKVKYNSPYEKIDPWLEGFERDMDRLCRGHVDESAKDLVHPDLYSFVSHAFVKYVSL